MCFGGATNHFYRSNCDSVSASKRGKIALPLLKQTHFHSQICKSDKQCQRRRKYEHKFIVRPFAWRSTDTIEFIKLLDKVFHNNNSAHFKRQIKERVTGPFSAKERARNTLPTLA